MKNNPIKKCYLWILDWADKPSAHIFLFALAFAESSFFPIPPDVLLIPLVLGAQKKWFKLALGVTIASAAGGVFGYLIGHYLWWSGHEYSSLANFFFNHVPGFSQVVFENIRDKYQLYGFWIVFTAGFTPVPYKIFTVSSGAFNLNMSVFIIASVISRGARFFIISFLIKIYGESIKDFIDKYFNKLAILFTIILIGGFLIIKKMV